MTREHWFGVSQRQRLAPALGARMPDLDRRTDAQLLAMGAQFASLFSFYGPDGTLAGDFGPFFSADAQIAAALIATFPLEEVSAKLGAILRRDEPDSWQEVVATLLRLWRVVNDWSETFPRPSPFDLIAEQLEAQIGKRLGPALGALAGLDELPASLSTEVEAFARAVDPLVWRGLQQTGSSGVGAASRDPLGALRESIALTLEGLAAIVRAARDAVQNTAWLYPRAPQVALYIAFLRQFSRVRARMNELPARHLDFYFRSVLRQREQEAVGEQTWVVFQVKEHAAPVELVVGTRVQGKSGTPIFRTLTRVTASEAQVTALHSLYTATEPGAADRLVVWSRSYAAPEIVDGTAPGWPTFGGVSGGQAGPVAVPAASLGIALAAPCLNGIDGDRSIRLEITLSPNLTLPANASECFEVQVSAGKEWLIGQADPSAQATEPAPQAANVLVLRFKLPAQLPVASPPAMPLDLSGFPAGATALRCLVQSGSDGIPSWVRQLQIERVAIHLDVSGATPGKLYSMGGVLPARGLSAPFGATPELGTYVEVRESPILALQPARLTLTLHWQGLPSVAAGFKRGFASYYAGYVDSVEVQSSTSPPVVSSPPAALAATSPMGSRASASAPPADVESGPKPEPILEGMDVYHGQGDIQWANVKGIEFCWVKASEGETFADPAFARNWVGAKGARIRRGAYHLFKPNDSVAAQLTQFLSHFPEGYDGELPPALDLEYASIRVLSAELVAQRAHDWLSVVQAKTGKVPVIYAGPQSMHYLGNPAALVGFPRWVASLTTAAAPAGLPPGWEDWTFWQYGKGRVPGVPAEVDLDRFRGDATELDTLVKYVATSPAFDNFAFQVETRILGATDTVATVAPVKAAAPKPRGLFVDAAEEPLQDGPRPFDIELTYPSDALPQRLRLEIVAPPYGFGRRFFASSVNAATLANASLLLSQAIAPGPKAPKDSSPQPTQAPSSVRASPRPDGKAAEPARPGGKAKPSPAGAAASELTKVEQVVEDVEGFAEKSGLSSAIEGKLERLSVPLTLMRWGAGLLKRLFGSRAPSAPALGSGSELTAGNAIAQALHAEVAKVLHAEVAQVDDGATQASDPAGSSAVLQPIPQPPFTPMVVAITADFQVSKTLYDAAAPAQVENVSGQKTSAANSVWHVQPAPFHQGGPAQSQNGAVSFAPIVAAGNVLQLTLTGVVPGQVVALLWVMPPSGPATSTAALRWEVWCEPGQWRELSVVLASTGIDSKAQKTSTADTNVPDLTRTSLIHVVVPRDAVASPKEGIQLRIMDASKTYAGRTLAIFTNAALAVRVLEDPTQPLLDLPIPAGTLVGLSPPVAALSKLFQPMSGFGGRRPDDRDRLFGRVSERLRHKARALTSWDYERLALDASDGIFAARCLPASGDNPGVVTMILVPQVRIPGGGALGFPPRLDPNEIETVRSALQPVMPPAARLQLRPSVYDVVRVRCTVRAKTGIPSTEAYRLLQHDLQNYLSAWVYSPDTAEGVRASIPDVLSFRRYVKGLPYISELLGDCTCEVARATADAAPVDSHADAWVIPVSSPTHDIVVL